MDQVQAHGSLYLIPGPRHVAGPCALWSPLPGGKPQLRKLSSVTEEALPAEAGRGGETVRRCSEHAQIPCVPPWCGGAWEVGAAQVSRTREEQITSPKDSLPFFFH